MASADPAVTASPSSHVGIANVRRDATRRTRDFPANSSGDSPFGPLLSHPADTLAWKKSLFLTWRTLTEEPSRSPFQCPPANRQRISSAARNPLLADGPVISSGNIRCTYPSDIRCGTTGTLRDLRAYHTPYLLLPCTRKHTYTTRGDSTDRSSHDSFPSHFRSCSDLTR